MTSSRRSPIEPLEHRRLFAAIAFNGRVLSVVGSGSEPNTITIGLTPDGTQAVATVHFTQGAGSNALPRTLTRTVPAARLKLVNVTGSRANDTITIDQTKHIFLIRTNLNGAAGNDTIVGGSGPDLILGTTGNDLMLGGAGNDTLIGGRGNDSLYGNEGDDHLDGQGGDDLESGDAGNDIIHDSAGLDTSFGGAGNDVFQLPAILPPVVTDFTKGQDRYFRIKRFSFAPANTNTFGVLGSLFPILNLFG